MLCLVAKPSDLSIPKNQKILSCSQQKSGIVALIYPKALDALGDFDLAPQKKYQHKLDIAKVCGLIVLVLSVREIINKHILYRKCAA